MAFPQLNPWSNAGFLTYQLLPTFIVTSLAFAGVGPAGLPAVYSTILVSIWVEFPDDAHQILVNVDAGSDFSGFFLTLGLNIIEVSFNNSDNTQIGSAILSVSGLQPGQWANFVVSADTATQTIQAVVSGATTEFTAVRWESNNPMTAGNVANILISSTETDANTEFCAANYYMTSPGNFFDLTDPANLGKFFNNSGEPVDMGPNGEKVTGSPPSVFLTVPMGAPASAVYANFGTSGSLAQQDTAEINGETFTYAPMPISLCPQGPFPRPPATFSVTTAISLPCNPCCELPTKLVI